MVSTSSADLELMRAAILLDSDPAAAARCASNILANSPGNDEAKLLLAAACRQMGDPAASMEVLESLARAHPASPVMQLELGRTYAAGGRHAEALTAFRHAVALDESLADGWRDLAAQQFRAGDVPAGDAAYGRYSRLMWDPHELMDAKVALADNRVEVAEAGVRRHLVRMPDDVVALRLLADVAARRGDRAEAEKCLTRCLDHAPGDAAARHDLARLLYGQERIAEVLPLVERLLANEPDNTDYLSLKAQAIRLVGRTTEAISLMDRVVALTPDDAQGWLVFGNLMREVGEQARSIEMYRHSIALQPGFGEAYWALANLKTFRFTEEQREIMQRLLANSLALGSSRAHLEFALGKAFEDAGQFASSFEHYARGNALRRATIESDPAATTAFVGRSKSMYTKDFFADRCRWGSQRPDPIFIVGLPRSGSTLLEQILASHSRVEGTRELPDVPALAMDLVSRSHPDRRAEYPEQVASLDRAQVEAMAVRYLTGTEARRPLGRPRFVDKMLGNFSHVGLIHLMFPRASIIDARRHPLGCSFSCYKQLFSKGMNFTYDLSDLGRYYRDYIDLTEHMDAVLPGRVHRVHYEQLVADPESEVRRLLNHCELPFEDECLRFYDNRRVVQTVSSEQVRLPIFPDSVDQWRNFDPWLGPLKEALGDLPERYPAT